MKTVTHTCDIKGCENEAKHINKQMQVVFNTEQTEGRNVAPYLSNEKVDLCEDCISRLIKNLSYISASGAMGHNKYVL